MWKRTFWNFWTTIFTCSGGSRILEEEGRSSEKTTFSGPFEVVHSKKKVFYETKKGSSHRHKLETFFGSVDKRFRIEPFHRMQNMVS